MEIDGDGTIWIADASGGATCSFGTPEDEADAERCMKAANLYASAPSLLAERDALREALRECASIAENGRGLCADIEDGPAGTIENCFESIQEAARAALAGGAK